jgi:hypothetical protein
MASTDALGRSLELRDGDLVLTGGQLAEVAGLPNLIQALTLRVLTPLGDDQFNTTYGFDAAAVFAQSANARTVRDLVQLNLVRTLGADARVREIRDVTFLDPPAGSLRRAWPVVVTIITVDGAQQTVPLTVGA